MILNVNILRHKRFAQALTGLAVGTFLAGTVIAGSTGTASADTAAKPKPTPTPNPAIAQITNEALGMLTIWPNPTIDKLTIKSKYALVVYSTGEAGGAMLFGEGSNGQWNYLCSAKGAFVPADVKAECGVPEATFNALL